MNSYFYPEIFEMQMEINDELFEQLCNDDNLMLAIYIPVYNNRKTLHEYLDFKYPLLGHYSIVDDKLKAEQLVITMFNCCSKRKTLLKIPRYQYGVMDNNKDECYYGECVECGETHCWECNYDAGHIINNHNIILIGKQIPHKMKRQDPIFLYPYVNDDFPGKLYKISECNNFKLLKKIYYDNPITV